MPQPTGSEQPWDADELNRAADREPARAGVDRVEAPIVEAAIGCLEPSVAFSVISHPGPMPSFFGTGEFLWNGQEWVR